MGLTDHACSFRFLLSFSLLCFFFFFFFCALPLAPAKKTKRKRKERRNKTESSCRALSSTGRPQQILPLSVSVSCSERAPPRIHTPRNASSDVVVYPFVKPIRWRPRQILVSVAYLLCWSTCKADGPTHTRRVRHPGPPRPCPRRSDKQVACHSSAQKKHKKER